MKRHWPVFVPLALGALVSVLVLAFEMTPGPRSPTRILGIIYDARLNETILAVACALVALGLLGFAVVRRRRSRRGLAMVALAVTTAVCGFCYLYGARGLARQHFGKWHDTFHYTLGAKYFSEVGYLDFYACAATAHAENIGAAGAGWKMRDLRTYKFVPAHLAIGTTDCHAKFSAARWAEFRRDIALFHRHKSIVRLLSDHGYNGAPFHTFLATNVAIAHPLDYSTVTGVSLIDIGLISVMLSVVIAAFGPGLGFLFAILFFTNFSDRFYFIGGSMMRYAWMASLTCGLAMIKARRYRTAGVLMTISALLNVFPVLFFLGIAIRMASTMVRNRVFEVRYRRFVAASCVTAMLGLGLGAAHGGGVSNYSEFLGFIGSHSQKLTSSRTGLRYTVLARLPTGENSKAVSYKTKSRQLVRASPFLFVLGAALIGFGIALCVRLDDVEASALFGVLVFFVAFGTVEYYYALTPILLFAFHRSIDSRAIRALAGALFALMAVVLTIWLSTASLRFGNNTAMSAGLLSFLSLTLIVLGRERGLLRWSHRCQIVAAAAAVFLGPAIALGSALYFHLLP